MKWRITNAANYYTRLGGLASNARNRLAQRVNDALRSEFGNRSVQQVISGDRVKIMFWDRSGFCIWYKRLEQGVFRLPQSIVNMSNPEVEVADLSLILEGIDLSSARRRKRFVLGTRQEKCG